jgi:hypothetical protein
MANQDDFQFRSREDGKSYLEGLGYRVNANGWVFGMGNYLILGELGNSGVFSYRMPLTDRGFEARDELREALKKYQV